MTLDPTARFSVSVVDDDGNDEWFDGQCERDEWFDAASSEHATAPIVAGLRFATDSGDETDEVSSDAAGAAAVNTDPPVDPSSASSFGARACFALTFALLAIGAAYGLASVGTFAAMDASSCEIPVVTSEQRQVELRRVVRSCAPFRPPPLGAGPDRRRLGG